MRKVFIKDKPLTIVDTLPETLGEDGVLVMEFDGSANLKVAVEMLEKNFLSGVVILHRDEEEAWNALLSNFKIIEAAGGLVKNSKNHLLFIKRYGKWDLPKGKIEKGETPDEAAVREVEEECGLEGLILSHKAAETHHTYEENHKKILKFTHWYFIDIKGEPKLTPQKEEGITEVKWIAPENLGMVMGNTYSSIRELLSNLPGLNISEG